MSSATSQVKPKPTCRIWIWAQRVFVIALLSVTTSSAFSNEAFPPTETLFPSARSAIHIHKVVDYQKNKQLLIDSESSFQLPENIIQAIDHEVPLSFKIEIELLEKSKIMGYEYDRQRRHILFHNQLYSSGVNRLYALFNTRNKKVQTFTQLDEALRTLATLNEFPVASLSELHPGQRYTLRMRINLDLWKLPAPLLLEALFTNKWILDSQWYETSINPPLSWQ